ncbi:MAG: hypothetical protein E6Q50_00145 [Lysobacter sp.]|nr:MAG: hypothetical protein E6Q50_00145 [Lysobacter sp.]
MRSDVAPLRSRVRAGIVAVVMASTVFACSGVQAQRDATSAAPADACAVSAYIVRPAEPAVRATPNRSGAVVGRLRAVRYDADDIEGAEVAVVDIRNGWARIAAASARNEAAHDIPAGWVETRHLGFVLQTEAGFAAPDPGSAMVYSAEDWIPSDRVARYLGCRGEWLHLTVRDARDQRRTGWFRGACANQRTTCDGTFGDRRRTDAAAD